MYIADRWNAHPFGVASRPCGTQPSPDIDPSNQPKADSSVLIIKRLEIVFVELQVVRVLFTCDWRFILRSVSQAWFGTGNALLVHLHGAS